MARIELNSPQQILYQVDIAVRVSDINYGGHVGNDSILSIMQEARVQFYRSLGFRDEINFEGSVGQIIADAAVQYKSEAFLGDVIAVGIGIQDLNKYGFDMLYVLTNKITGVEIARGKTGIVCFDYSKRKVARIPDNLLQKLGYGK